METLSETVGRIVDKDVTTDKNKEISEYVHRIIKYLCLLKKRIRFKKIHIRSGRRTPQFTAFHVLSSRPGIPNARAFLYQKKAPHAFECRADSFIIFFVMQFVLSKKESNSFYQKKDSHPKM